MVLPVPAEPETRAGPAVVALHPLPLLGVQEDRPLLPRKVERALPAPRRSSSRGSGAGRRDDRTGFARRDDGLRHCGACRRSPVPAAPPQPRRADGRPRPAACPRSPAGRRRATRRHAVAEQFVVGRCRRTAACFGGLRRRFGLHVDRDDDLLHRLANLDQLRRARLRMRLQLAPLGPVVGLVVVIDVAEQQARIASCGRSAGCRCSPAPTRSSCPSPCRACGSSCRDWPG